MKESRLAAVTLELKVRRRVRRGEAVTIVLTVRNNGSDPATLYLRGRPIAFEITVVRQNGEIIWRRLENQIVDASLQLLELAPGDSFELTDYWNQVASSGKRIPAGVYLVEGEVPTQPRVASLKTARAWLEIV